jgi:hypothetical protein
VSESHYGKSIYYSHAYLSSKKEQLSPPNSFSTTRPQIAGLLVSSYSGGADRFAFNRASPVGGKSTKINNARRMILARDNKYQQKSTKINRVSKSEQKSAKVSKSEQKSAKVSKISPRSMSVVSKSQQKSSQIIRNHQKSSPVWTVSRQKSSIIIRNHHFLLWFANRCSGPRRKQGVLEHKGVCHGWAGNELQIPLAN